MTNIIISININRVVLVIDRPCAIVTDVRYRMSIPVIRSLGKKKIKVIAAEREGTKSGAALGFHSKYTAESMRYPAPDTDERGFIAALMNRAEQCGTRPVIIPVGMDSVLAIAANKNEIIRRADISISNIRDIVQANDKYSVLGLAGRLGIPCPDTARLKEGEDYIELSEKLKYPVVIKHTSGELLGLDPQSRYDIVYDKREFAARYLRMHELSPFPLVQEYVEGGGFGVSAVFDENHTPVSIFCHRRIREYPVSGGPSCFCASDWNDELVGYAVELLRALNWVGVAMVEFKGSRASGYKLMEINPRVWGSLALSCAAGCDIPYSLYRAARGELSGGLPAVPDYRLNKKMRFILQDLLSFRGYMRTTPNKLGFALGFARDLLNPTVKDGVLSIEDLSVSIKYLKSALGKRDRIIR